jgi:SAM-dependent methyltransferase
VVGDGHRLPFLNDSFDYIWCNAVLEHVPDPMQVASEIARILKPEGLAFIQVPFLENVHGWPQDYYRFTIQGLRVLFRNLEEVQSGVSAGPSQLLPDLVQYYCVAFAELQNGKLLTNLLCLIPGALLLPMRLLDHILKNRPSYWKWARAYYWVGRKPLSPGLELPSQSVDSKAVK